MKKIVPYIIILLVSCNGNREERTYFNGGKIQSIYVKNKNGFFNGKCYDYYENGNKKCETEYIDGRIEGIRKIYYINGNLEIQATYRRGIHNGPYVSYSENKELNQIAYYINDTLIYQLEFRNNKLVDWSQTIDLTIARDTIKIGESQSLNTCIRSTFIDSSFLLKIYITKETAKGKLLMIDYAEKQYKTPEIVKYSTTKIEEAGSYFVHVKYYAKDKKFIFCGYILFYVIKR